MKPALRAASSGPCDGHFGCCGLMERIFHSFHLVCLVRFIDEVRQLTLCDLHARKVGVSQAEEGLNRPLKDCLLDT